MTETIIDFIDRTFPDYSYSSRIDMVNAIDKWRDRAQPKYKRVDLETLYKNTCNCEGDGGPCLQCTHDFGWNEAIDDIKSKYGDLYMEAK